MKYKNIKIMNQGILLLIIGDKYYGEMALNLCLSLKLNDESIKIHGILSGEAGEYIKTYNILNSYEDFDISDYIIDNKINISYLKLNLNKLTPFRETLFLDVDTIMFDKKISDIMFELSNYKLNIIFQNINITDKIYNGERSIMHWVTEEKMLNYLNITDKFKYVFNSFFLYWINNEYTDNIFNESKKYYKLIEESENLLNLKWNGFIPDEICFTITCNILNIETIKTPWTPIAIASNFNISEENNYYGITYPSKKINNIEISKYLEDKVKSLRNHYNILESFNFSNKRYFSLEKIKNINLFTYFNENDDVSTFLYSLINNINNNLINKIFVFISNNTNELMEHDKITYIKVEKLNFKTIIDYCNEFFLNSICIFSKEIYYDESLKHLKYFDSFNDIVLILGGWIKKDNKFILNNNPLEDTKSLIFLPPLNLNSNIINLNNIGYLNKLSYLIEISNKITSNPSLLIKSISLQNNNKNKNIEKGFHLLVKTTDDLNIIGEKRIENMT